MKVVGPHGHKMRHAWPAEIRREHAELQPKPERDLRPWGLVSGGWDNTARHLEISELQTAHLKGPSPTQVSMK